MGTECIDSWPLSTTRLSTDASLRENPTANIRIILISAKSGLHGKHFFCWQYGIIFILFQIVATKSEAKLYSQTGAETDFNTRKWHLNSLKVTHFRVIRKPTRHFMKPHNNIGFDSKGCEDTASKSTKMAVFDHPTFV